MSLVKTVSADKHTFWQKMAAGHKEQLSQFMMFMYKKYTYKKMEDIGLTKSSPENVYLKAYSASFSQSTEYFPPDLHSELLSGCVEGQWLQWAVTSSL